MKKLLTILLLFPALFLSAQVSPFLSTTWNQTCYYNDSCPTVSSGGSCGKAYTGCNATAMGMICKYYSWPSTGFSSHCNSNLPAQCVSFAAQTYNYSSMPNNVTSANTEVARLLAHLGAACDMQYSGSSSNSFFDATVLKRYFRYSPRMYGTASFMFSTTQELIDAIKLELNAGRPVFCKGGNHFYLIDGYDASDNFHVNFGWSGVYNGYYPITGVTNAAGNFTPGNFIFMIRPMTGDLETGGDTITVTASASVTQFEFSSQLPWTMSSPTPWISTALSSGSPGYFSFSEGNTFTPQVNQGGVRYGYIFIQNANDTDTIVIKQEASPLGVNPDTLYYADMGGTQSAAINYYSWASWTASSPFSWISISPASGTGNGTPNVTVTTNPNNTPRSGYVAVSGGVFRDTIRIEQDANLSTGTADGGAELYMTLYPNPASGYCLLLKNGNAPAQIRLKDIGGREILHLQAQGAQTILPLDGIAPGVYIAELEEQGRFAVKRIVVE